MSNYYGYNNGYDQYMYPYQNPYQKLYQNPYEIPRPQYPQPASYGQHIQQQLQHYQQQATQGHQHQAHMATQGDIQTHLDLGRKGHCFRGHWAGRDHTFILVDLRADGTVDIIENNQPGTVHRTDIVGLTYLGVQCPAPPQPPHCHWYFDGWTWQKYCH